MRRGVAQNGGLSGMDTPSTDLFSLPAERIDFDTVRRFVELQEETTGLTESRVLELKQERSKRNIVEAVAALSNTDGGLVLLGVAEDASGDQRFVGVHNNEQDAIVNQFRLYLPPDAMPEVIPVAIPDKNGQLIIVLRCDADRVRHPVVVNGRVLVRVPGQSVAASRDQIAALVDRDQYPDVGVVPSLVAPGDLMHFPFWPKDAQPALTFRMLGGLSLPPRATNSPWLNSAAKTAVLESLSQSPIPDGLDTRQVQLHETERSWWEITEARSDSCRLIANTVKSLSPNQRHDFKAAAYVYREPRQVGLMLGIGISPNKNLPPGPWTDIEDVYEWLLAGALTITETCRLAAAALDAAEPTALAPFQAWLQSSSGSLTNVLPLQRWERHGANELSFYWFKPAAPGVPDVDGLHGLALNWLTCLLLDCGAHLFEDDINALRPPKWPGRQ